MDRSIIEMQLTATERSLLLRYGYPFRRIEEALKAFSTSKATEIVPMDSFELEQMIGDLCSSINDMKSCPLLDRLIEFCDRLEAAHRYGDGMLGWL